MDAPIRMWCMPAIAGVLLAVSFFLLAATISHFTLSRNRLTEVIQSGFSTGALSHPIAQRNQDYLTECAIFSMLYLRHDRLLSDISDTVWLEPSPYQNSCASLQALVEGSDRSCHTLAGESSALCTATISWNIPSERDAQITMRIPDTGAEWPLARGASGSFTRRLFADRENIFRVYADSGGNRLMFGSASIRVGVNGENSVVNTGQMKASEPTNAATSAPFSHIGYLFGSRFLDAVAISILNLNSARLLYGLLSYGSVLFLICSSLFHSRTRGLWVLPIGILLLLGFSQHNLGGNLAHSPGFFLGFFALAVFLAARERFQQLPNRIGFFFFLGLLVSFFDLLNGALPVLLSLTIVLNHLFYVAPNAKNSDSRAQYWRHSILEAAGVFACFLATYAALNFTHVVLLRGFDSNAWQEYVGRLALKLASDSEAAGSIGRWELLSRLWEQRIQLVPGGNFPSTLLLFAASVAWLFTLTSSPLVISRRTLESSRLTADLFILFTSGIGILGWWLLLPDHTFILAPSSVRIAALPVAYGMVALILFLRFVRKYLASPEIAVTCLALLIISLAVPAYAIQDDLGIDGDSYTAKFVASPAVDSVVCAPLGFYPDGEPDGIVEVSSRGFKTPVTLFRSFFQTEKLYPVFLSLLRTHPEVKYETGRETLALGISRTLDGPLLNDSDGSVAIETNAKFYLHFCRDGNDTEDSQYQVQVGGGRIVPVVKE